MVPLSDLEQPALNSSLDRLLDQASLAPMMVGGMIQTDIHLAFLYLQI